MIQNINSAHEVGAVGGHAQAREGGVSRAAELRSRRSVRNFRPGSAIGRTYLARCALRCRSLRQSRVVSAIVLRKKGKTKAPR